MPDSEMKDKEEEEEIKGKKGLSEVGGSKTKEDFGPLIEASIPQNRDLALKQGKKAEAIENLLGVEKTTRLAQDAIATGKVAVAIVKLLHELGDWEGLNSHIVLLSKRRQQLKQVLVEIVQEAMKYLDATPNHDAKMELIKTLRAVTEGKIHVELERARLTRTLAKIREDEGNVVEAAELMQEVQVETYGSMDKEEKVDYILEQVRLCLDKGDFVRGTIVSKKITAKTFEKDALQELKLRYYKLMNRIYLQEDQYLNLANSFHSSYKTPIVQEDPVQWMALLKSVVIFLVLAPHDNHQADFLARLVEDKKLDDLKPMKVLLTYFKTLEIIRWSALKELYTGELSQHEAFQGEKAAQRWEDLQKRVIQHNIRVISTYYSDIKMPRLSQLLELSGEDCEKHVCDMVVAKSLWCRIERTSGVATFTPASDPNDTLNAWSNNISELLSKVEKMCHLIHKENMMAGNAK